MKHWPINLDTAPVVDRLSNGTHGVRVDQETFLLPKLWMLHFYDYHGDIEVDGVRVQIQPGSISVTPPGYPITFHYKGLSKHLYCHFQQPLGLPTDSDIPFFIDAIHCDFNLERILREAVSFRYSNPVRVSLRLWDVLLGLVEIGQRKGEKPKHSIIIDRMTQIAEEEIATDLSIGDLARRCEISHNQLIRLFRKYLACTPAAWLRRLRASRARELLSYSDSPIKVIACDVGIPDLQHFNKVIRREFGVSPRQIRKAREASN